jgi:ABC-type lipoprotein export system ATPase subunit
MILADCANVTHEYRDAGTRVTALDDVSLEIGAGELVLVAGPSGSGKSTLLSVLAGLVRASRGRTSLCGSSLSSLDDEARARVRREHVGFVFQSFHLFAALTARANVECVLEMKGIPRAPRRRLAREALARVGLAERLDHRPDQLSGGERQRVAVARRAVGVLGTRSAAHLRRGWAERRPRDARPTASCHRDADRHARGRSRHRRSTRDGPAIAVCRRSRARVPRVLVGRATITRKSAAFSRHCPSDVTVRFLQLGASGRRTMQKRLGGVVIGAAIIGRFLGGCGSDDESTAANVVDAAPPEASTPTQGDAGRDAPPAQGPVGGAFCDATFNAFVDAYLGCCTAEDKATDYYQRLSALMLAGRAACGTRLDEGIAKGRLVHNPDKAAACIAAYKKFVGAGVCGIDLDGNDRVFPECADAFTGTVVAGSGCRGDHECKSGLTCVDFTTDADGTCKAPPPIGDACGEGRNDGGAPNLSYRYPFGTHPACASGAWCSSHTCRAAAGAGETCLDSEQCATGLRCFQNKCGTEGPSEVDGPCRSPTMDCKPGQYLYCDGPSLQQGTCKARKAANQPCSKPSECRGLCEKPDGGTTGTCRAICGSG